MAKETERKLTLIHRVIVPDGDKPREYAILLTDRRAIFIPLKQTRSAFVLRREMRFGTALVTDVAPKTFDDYQDADLGSLASDPDNLAVAHADVASLTLNADQLKFHWYEFFVRLTMRMQKETFQVYHADLAYRKGSGETVALKLYMVPLGAYFKPRRLVTTREKVLREYAEEEFQLYRSLLPN